MLRSFGRRTQHRETWAPGDQERQAEEDNVGEPWWGGAVMADDAGRLARLFSWCGMALMAAGVLMVVATLLHPSRETATTIVASESRLVAAHVVYTMAWLLVLLGLPELYAAQRGGMGRLGLVGFLAAFAGTYLIAVTGNFGFLAPVLAKDAPAVLDAIAQYWPVVIVKWVGGNLVHDRLRPVWRRHDQNRDPASLGRNPGCCGRSGPSAGLGHFPPSFYGRMAGRHPGQREPWARLGVVRLPDAAHTGRFRCVAFK
jgi:hypothetical protein